MGIYSPSQRTATCQQTQELAQDHLLVHSCHNWQLYSWMSISWMMLCDTLASNASVIATNNAMLVEYFYWNRPVWGQSWHNYSHSGQETQLVITTEKLSDTLEYNQEYFLCNVLALLYERYIGIYCGAFITFFCFWVFHQNLTFFFFFDGAITSDWEWFNIHLLIAQFCLVNIWRFGSPS